MVSHLRGQTYTNIADDDIYFRWLRILRPFLVLFVASCPNAVELNTSKDVITCVNNENEDEDENGSNIVIKKSKGF